MVELLEKTLLIPSEIPMNANNATGNIKVLPNPL